MEAGDKHKYLPGCSVKS